MFEGFLIGTAVKIDIYEKYNKYLVELVEIHKILNEKVVARKVVLHNEI